MVKSPSPFFVMNIGSLELLASFDISFDLFLKSDIGFIIGFGRFIIVCVKIISLF